MELTSGRFFPNTDFFRSLLIADPVLLVVLRRGTCGTCRHCHRVTDPDSFALISLWVLMLIASRPPHHGERGGGRSGCRHLVCQCGGRGAADGKTFATIFNPQAGQRWPIDGAAHELVIGDSRVIVQFEHKETRLGVSI